MQLEVTKFPHSTCNIMIFFEIDEIIPTYLMPALQGVSFPCLFFPAKTSITSLFGGVAPFEGLGFFELSFDWNMVGAGSPLATPLFAQVRGWRSHHQALFEENELDADLDCSICLIQGLQVLSAVITAVVFWPAYKYSWFGWYPSFKLKGSPC